MIFDSFVLRNVIRELEPKIKGTAVQKIRQSENLELLLELRAPGWTYNLLICCSPLFSRLYLTGSGIKGAEKAPDFCMILRKHLVGSRLVSAQQLKQDRIAEFGFAAADGTEYFLYCELMGRHSNMVLVNAEGIILGAAKPVGRSLSSVRQILVGKSYTLPPNTDKVNPYSISEAEFGGIVRGIGEATVSQGFIKSFVSAFAGISPVLAGEIWCKLTPADIHEAFCRLYDLDAADGCYLHIDDKGRAVGAYPVFLHSLPAGSQREQLSLNEALDTAYRSVIARSVKETVRQNLLQLIGKAISYRKSAKADCLKTIDRACDAERSKELGDLILGAAFSIKKGDSSISLTDYYDPEMKTIAVELDARLSASENADRYYKKSKRLKASVRLAEERIPVLENELGILTEAKNTAETEEKTEVLRSLKQQLSSLGLLREMKRYEEEAKAFAGYKIKRVYSPEGWEVLYGESSEANDYLTLRLARPNDIWFHGRQITGSHVIVRTTAKTCSSVPYGTIMFAARLAAANSQAKHSSLVPVDYTFKKFVRKPKGSPAGFVIYRQEKTIDVNMKG